MKSCDWEVLSSIVKGLTYNQISYMCGIKSYMREFKYANETFYIGDGRGNINFLNILSKIGIEFHEIDIHKINELKNLSNIVILAPLEFISNISNIKPESIQISAVYSAFRIKKFNNEIIELFIETPLSTKNFILTLPQLEKLINIRSKPLGKGCFIISIDNYNNYSVDTEEMNKILKQSLTSDIVKNYYIDEGTEYVTGDEFFNKFEDIIKSSEFWSDNNKEYLKRFFFIATLNAGAECFYRKDFLESIIKYRLIDQNSNIYLNLHHVSNLWRDLNKKLRKLQVENIAGMRENYQQGIISLINDIKDLEYKIINDIKRKIL